MNRLTKKDLIEKLGATLEEAKIVVAYEGLFPELLQEDEGFKIDSETLWDKLDKPQTEYRKFKNRKIIEVFQNNIDYEIKWTKNNKIVPVDKIVRGLDVNNLKQMNGNGYKETLFLTIDCAKHIALMTNNNKGKLVRDSFILCEKFLRKNIEWIKTRHPEKESYKQLCVELDKQFQQMHNDRHPQNFTYSNEANMINIELIGKNAKQINEFFNNKNDGHTRDSLTEEMNKAIYELEVMDMGFVMTGMVYEQRKQFIRNIVNNKYSHLKDKLNSEYKKLVDSVNE